MSRLTLATTLLIIVAGFLALLVGIDKPFVGHHDYNNRLYRQIARNYLARGVLELKFGQLTQANTKTPLEPEKLYTHHPPLLPLMLTGAINIAGDSERSVRLVPIVLSVGALAIFFLFLRQYFSYAASVFATAFWIITPMFLYFGKMADHEAVTLFFIVFSAYFFFRWLKAKERKYFLLTLTGLFLGQWTGWPAYFLAAAFFLFSLHPVFVVLSLLNFGFFVLDTYLVTGSAIGGNLWGIFLFRMGVRQLPWVQEIYTNRQLAIKEAKRMMMFYSYEQVGLAIFAGLGWAWITFREKFRLAAILKPWIIFSLVAFAHVLVFRTGAWRHDYWIFYFLPSLAWGVALSFDLLINQLDQKYRYPLYAIYFVLLVLAYLGLQPFFWSLQSSGV